VTDWNETSQIGLVNALRAECEAMRVERDALAEALVFYADAETYFAIAFMGDPPHGEFLDDFDADNNMGVEKPGKRARDALRAMAERTPKEPAGDQG